MNSMTVYRHLLKVSGMTRREAAIHLHEVSPATVSNWSFGRKGNIGYYYKTTIDDALSHLRSLISRQNTVGVEIADSTKGKKRFTIDVFSDDAAARKKGWPCKSAHDVAVGIGLSDIDDDAEITFNPI